MTDKTFRQTLTVFDTSRTKTHALRLAAGKAEIPGRIGVGRALPTLPGGRGGGGEGSALSDLTEKSGEDGASTRTFHESRTVTSSDGLFALTIRPVKQLTMLNTDGVEIRLNLNAA